MQITARHMDERMVDLLKKYFNVKTNQDLIGILIRREDLRIAKLPKLIRRTRLK